MFYIMKKFYLKNPPKVYVETINKGYEDCNLDKKYLMNALKSIR